MTAPRRWSQVIALGLAALMFWGVISQPEGPLETGEDGLRLSATGLASADVGAGMLAARANGRIVDPIERSGGAADAVPMALSLRYHDAARDYQAGMQRVTRPGVGRSEAGIELPAVLDADAARGLATERLQANWAGRAIASARSNC